MAQESALPPASLSKRTGAFVIDDLVINMILLIIFYEPLMALLEGMSTVNQDAVLMVNQFIVANMAVVFAVKVLYHTILVWQSGMTLGKYVMKIKVVDLLTSQKPRFTQAFWRASLRLVSEMFFYAGFIFALFSPLRQTLHDKLSNTFVIDA